jgi:hypothetical protein
MVDMSIHDSANAASLANQETLVAATRDSALGTPRLTLGRRAGFAAVAFALAIAMLGTTLPTPLYGLYREDSGFPS